MTASSGWFNKFSHLLHRHLLLWIVASYGLAATCPAWGLRIKDAVLVDLKAIGWGEVTAPKLLLAVLLFSAGMRVRVARVGALVRRPWALLAGLTANLTVPFLFLSLMVLALRVWHNPTEAAVVVVGLALVTAMPIAGSSTGWVQAADGDLALSLGLVLGSTLFSPLTTPALLHALGWLVPGSAGQQLHDLASRGTGTFLACWVLFPSLVGVATRWVLGERRAAKPERGLKIVAPLTLLLLCYVNAAACLPEVLHHPDWDFLAIILTFVAGLCTLTFAAGFILSRLLRVDHGERVALVFGLGMNNNGTGLVLATLALGSQPQVLLPIIIYNLTQHLIAGAVNQLLRQEQAADSADPAEVHSPRHPRPALDG